ncbi:hypothetical protein BSTAB16_3474 [Burkholderia stabilis]|uniref:Uncharacterized protein n=1 Tax=Burkholderia stabilis TaxID=95485 RepID=A0AAJ5N7L4_9BURK|nr:hypothetical protein BSTAB16_3474 [Burkholderia stabilis]
MFHQQLIKEKWLTWRRICAQRSELILGEEMKKQIMFG